MGTEGACWIAYWEVDLPLRLFSIGSHNLYPLGIFNSNIIFESPNQIQISSEICPRPLEAAEEIVTNPKGKIRFISYKHIQPFQKGIMELLNA
ncbi:MAG: hypothetical protein WB392_05400 [Methanotrichaceae archaeon]